MSDLISSLQSALRNPAPDGYTVAELLDKVELEPTHHNQLKIRKFLKCEIAAGRIIGKLGRRINISGKPCPVPVFVPVEKKIK